MSTSQKRPAMTMAEINRALGIPKRPCCDLHGRNCEPPSELCCENCTEARHAGWADERGTRRFGHPAGELCSSPDLSPNTLAEAAKIEAAVAAERDRIRQLAKRESFTLYRPGNGPAQQTALEVVPLAVLMQDQPS